MAPLPDRDENEESFARKLSGISTGFRHEAEDSIGFPPDLNKLPDTYWDRVDHEFRTELTAVLIILFLLSFEEHGGRKSDGDRLATLFAAQRAISVAGSFTQTSREMAATLQNRWQEQEQKAREGTGEPVKRSEVIEGLLGIFGPNRIEGLAITETTFANSAGGEAAGKITGTLDEKDIWITENDQKVCPICRPLHKKPRSVWSLKFPDGPPGHPRCRCYIHYANPVPEPEGVLA